MIQTRVLIADDDSFMREALAAIIASDSSLDLVAQACDAEQAITLALTHHPDVAILDVKMPFGGGTRATTEIRLKSPRTKILAFSAYGDRSTIIDLVRHGAHGYLVKGSNPSDLLSGIHNAHAGTSPLSPIAAHEVLGQLQGMLHQEDQAKEVALQRLTRLQQAMQGGIRTAYQPIVRLSDRAQVGSEALSRFSAGGSPSEWFASAAQAGVLVDFELSAIRSALSARPPLPSLYLALNASP